MVIANTMLAKSHASKNTFSTLLDNSSTSAVMADHSETLFTVALNVYMHTKFDHYSLNRSRHMADAQNLNGSRDLTITLSGTICHLRLRRLGYAG